VKGCPAHLPSVDLWPGELVVVERPTVVVTVLGSCVSVTLLHRRSGLGAICHALLPEGAVWGNEGGGFRYVEPSVRYMTEEFRRRGIGPRETEVKVFGGGDVLVTNMGPGELTVGARNVQAALGALQGEGYNVAASDVGGKRGRKIYFDTSTGAVLLKRLSKAVPEERLGERVAGRPGWERT
jgi:chemotaxis protein CheD